MNDEIRRNLIKKAKEGMRNSYSPYSNFKVGAALLVGSGEIYIGCNIENASYGAAICAERTTIVKAISDGKRELLAIAIVSSSGDLTFPCGICRQVMYEFMPEDAEIILEDKEGNIKVYTLDEIFPHGFKL